MLNKKDFLLELMRLFERHSIAKAIVDNDGIVTFVTESGEQVPVVSENGELRRSDLNDELAYVNSEKERKLLSMLKDCEISSVTHTGVRLEAEIEASAEFWEAATGYTNDDLYKKGMGGSDFRCRLIVYDGGMSIQYGDDSDGLDYTTIPITVQEDIEFWDGKITRK